MNGKYLGKINSFKFGFGGYDDAMFGASFTFKYDGWMGCGDFKGTWATDPSKHAKWTKGSQTQLWGDVVRLLKDMCATAKVNTINELEGQPIEIEIEGNKLKSWRLLEEVL